LVSPTAQEEVNGRKAAVGLVKRMKIVGVDRAQFQLKMVY